MMRPLPAHDYMALKAATRRLVKNAGGVENAASLTRVEKTVLGGYGNINTPHFMPIDVLADLSKDTGDVGVLHQLAMINAHVLVNVKGGDSPHHEFNVSLAALGKEISDVFSTASTELSDGTLTHDEVIALQCEVNEAMQALATLTHILEKMGDA